MSGGLFVLGLFSSLLCFMLASAIERLKAAERELSAIKRHRSAIVSRGNRTRAARAKAKRDQITSALRGEG